MSETIDQTGEMSAGQQQQDIQDKQPSAAELLAELAKVRDALKTANSEAATRRKKLDEYERAEAARAAAEQAKRDAELSETEKLNKKLVAAEQARQEALTTANQRLLRAAFVAEAALAGAEFPDDAFRLADQSGVTVDENGDVSGVKEAVKTIVESGRLPLKNKRVVPPNLDPGAGGGQKPADVKAAQLTEAELDMARKMRITPEQYAANKQRR